MSGAPRKEVLVAAMQDVRPLAGILRGVHFSDKKRATIAISEEGLMVTVEYNKLLLASAYLFEQMFNEYTYTKPVLTDGEAEEGFSPILEINLSLLLSALDVFGGAGLGSVIISDKDKVSKGRARRDDWDGNGMDRVEPDDRKKATAMRLTWLGKGHPLCLHLTDAPNVSTVCELTTFEPDPAMDVPFDNGKVAARIIMKSSWLRDALSEIDPKSSKLTMICTPPQAHGSNRGGKRKATFKLKAVGNLGTTTMDYPDDKDVLEVAEFRSEEPVSFTYPFECIAKSVPALRNSLKTSLRIDSEGILSLQFMIPFRQHRMSKDKGVARSQNFIEFMCASLFDD
ncbi:Rad1-domain-containing protein [Calocera viscosa TUFC12733]|uniref:Rad1-domain-containing protein n=1 Tax=Calocera viscosa (strain TUFC12733) TaxID=1330018 RepID=A0A167GBB4_CALVF|nr:Rad1-domain-containing protein [Calocera viscosa TUFC12733]